MAVAFGTSTTATGNDVTTFDISVPASTADGDMLILAVVVSESSGVTSTVPGFTQKMTVNGGADEDITCSVFWRRASSEPGTYTITPDGTYGNYAAASMLRYTGVIRTGDPFRTSATVYNATQGTPQTSTTLSGVQATDMAFHMAGVVMGSWNTNAFDLAGPGGSWVERGEVYMTVNNTGKPGILYVEQLGTGTAPTYTATGTAAASNTIWGFCAGALMEEPPVPPLGSKIYTSASVRRASTW